tara:strand:- start:22092 stop:22307 length:216 start_codon:yes stop_codon:yes gene_type:complete
MEIALFIIAIIYGLGLLLAFDWLRYSYTSNRKQFGLLDVLIAIGVFVFSPIVVGMFLGSAVTQKLEEKKYK